MFSIDECVQGDVNGWILPIKSVRLIYPDKYNIKEIVISYDNESYIKTTYSPLPSTDECINNNTSFIPRNSISNVTSIEYINGYPTINLELTPLIYIPENNTIIYIQNISLYIVYEFDNEDRLSDVEIDEYPLDITNNKWLSSYDNRVLDNTYDGGLCNSTINISYVIITSTLLKDSFNELREFRENDSKISSKIVLIEDILKCPDYKGTDSAERLREFCKDAYLDWNTKYIVLGGTWQPTNTTNQIIPCRRFTDINCTYSINVIPSDLYFSNLDGDWRYNDTIWGGGKNGVNDLDSELYVGRIVAWTPEMVSNAIHKIILYDLEQDYNWLRNVSFWGGDLQWTSTSKQYLEEIRLGDSPYADFTGFNEWNINNSNILNLTRNYYHVDYGYEPTQLFKDSIDEVSIIVHLDHGSPSNILSLGCGSELSNIKYPIAVSGACLGGRYTDSSSCINNFMSSDDYGYSLMILNTGYGWGSSSTTNGATQYMCRYIWDFFFTTNNSEWQFGKSLNYARDKIAIKALSSSISWTYSWYSMNLFGDPYMSLNFGESNNIQLDAGINYINYTGVNTTLKNLSIDIPLYDDEAIGVLIGDIWNSWIVGFSTDYFNRDVKEGDYLYIYLKTSREWIIDDI
jgi:hypothetical protein